jgi:single-strand DNA-binding protein
MVRDPELRRTQSGSAVCSFSIAAERDSKDKEVDFIEIVAWGNAAEFVARYMTKGRMVACKGRLRQNSNRDKNGETHKYLEVVAESVYVADQRKYDGNSNRDSVFTQPYTDYSRMDGEDEDSPF